MTLWPALLSRFPVRLPPRFSDSCCSALHFQRPTSCEPLSSKGLATVIDNHALEKKAMDLFKAGRGAEASTMQDEFLKQVETSGEDYCTCPATCKFHGKCVECVVIHRGHGDHLPHCFQAMVDSHRPNYSFLPYRVVADSTAISAAEREAPKLPMEIPGW